MIYGHNCLQVVFNSIFPELPATFGRKADRVMVTAHQPAESQLPAPSQLPQDYNSTKKVKMGWLYANTYPVTLLSSKSGRKAQKTHGP